jgi:iron complex transport system ATP-binding protein
MLVEFRCVSFAYPEGHRPPARPFRVDGVSFHIAAGEILAVVGPNSAGKTTLVRLLTAVVRPSHGEIRLEGRPLTALAATEIARRIAVVPQGSPHGLPLTVAETVMLGRYPHAPDRFFDSDRDRDRCRAAMAMAGVLDLAAVALAGLSGGERQRVVLARALAQDPRLLVLDEPTTHLDLRHQAQTVALLRRLQHERGLAALVVSHDLNVAAEVGDRILLLNGGRVERIGTADAVLDEATLGRVYGCPVVVEKHPVTRRPAIHVVWPPH